jgi:hypothetical protein
MPARVNARPGPIAKPPSQHIIKVRRHRLYVAHFAPSHQPNRVSFKFECCVSPSASTHGCCYPSTRCRHYYRPARLTASPRKRLPNPGTPYGLQSIDNILHVMSRRYTYAFSHVCERNLTLPRFHVTRFQSFALHSVTKLKYIAQTSTIPISFPVFDQVNSFLNN